jgi:hypothetical protein
MCPLLTLALQGVFLQWLITVLTRQTRQALCAIEQSIFNMMSMVLILSVKKLFKKSVQNDIYQLLQYFY